MISFFIGTNHIVATILSGIYVPCSIIALVVCCIIKRCKKKRKKYTSVATDAPEDLVAESAAEPAVVIDDV